MKKPTVRNATKEEFVEFFLHSSFGGSGLWQFEKWLSNKRYKVLDDKLGAILDQMNEANKEMYEWSQKALKETDSKKKMDLYLKASECQERWSELEKKSSKIQKEIDEFLGL